MIRGFSLVELSIVLVILGLLTGGILAGQSLIRAAEMRGVTSEINRYINATYTFRDKYGALPGDMPNATRFWGTHAGSATTTGYDATCAGQTTAGTGTVTCNGTGDGNVGVTGSQEYERFRYWQHLANAGLIEGSYSGVRGSAGVDDPDIGVNVPASRLSSVGYYMLNMPTAHADFFPGTQGNLMTVGTETAVWTLGAGAIKPEEMWGIDTKMDDGKPAYGRIRNRHSSSGTQSLCVTTIVASTAEYALTSATPACAMILMPGF